MWPPSRAQSARQRLSFLACRAGRLSLPQEASVSTWNDPPGGFHPISASDYLPRAQLAGIQLQRLQSVVSLAYDRQALFRRRMDERGLAPDSITSLADLSKPVSYTHLRAHET